MNSTGAQVPLVSAIIAAIEYVFCSSFVVSASHGTSPPTGRRSPPANAGPQQPKPVTNASESIVDTC